MSSRMLAQEGLGTSIKAARKVRDRWNKENKVRTRVKVTMDNGQVRDTQTVSPAFLHPGEADVQVRTGIGTFSLEKVMAV